MLNDMNYPVRVIESEVNGIKCYFIPDTKEEHERSKILYFDSDNASKLVNGLGVFHTKSICLQ